MNFKPTYSVIIPAFNAEKFIEKCLRSVLIQTLAADEIIIIDDNSQDTTAELIKRFEAIFSVTNTKFIFISHSTNKGPSASRNTGIKQSNSAYIVFLDADDFWHKDKLLVIDHFIKNLNPGFLFHCYSENPITTETISPASYTPKKLNFYSILLRNPAATPCTVIRNSPNICFDETMHYCEDYDLWLRISEHTPIIKLIGPPLTQLGRPPLTNGGISGNRLKMRIGELKAYYNYCQRNWLFRFWLLPCLITLSCLKHINSYFLPAFKTIIKNLFNAH